MITFLFYDFNTSLKNLNHYSEPDKEFIYNNCFHAKCRCGSKGSFILYGTYERNVISSSRKKKVIIQRVQCQSCKTTHAILPAGVIPYKQHSTNVYQEFIDTYSETDSSFVVEERRIISTYTKWKYMLLTLDIVLTTIDNQLILTCSNIFKMCFLQDYAKQYHLKGELFTTEYLAYTPPT